MREPKGSPGSASGLSTSSGSTTLNRGLPERRGSHEPPPEIGHQSPAALATKNPLSEIQILDCRTAAHRTGKQTDDHALGRLAARIRARLQSAVKSSAIAGENCH